MWKPLHVQREGQIPDIGRADGRGRPVDAATGIGVAEEGADSGERWETRNMLKQRVR